MGGGSITQFLAKTVSETTHARYLTVAASEEDQKLVDGDTVEVED